MAKSTSKKEVPKHIIDKIRKQRRDRRPSHTPLLVCVCILILFGLIVYDKPTQPDSAPPVIPHIPISVLDGDHHTEEVFFNKHKCSGVTTDTPGDWYICTESVFRDKQIGAGVDVIGVDFLCKKINSMVCTKIMLTGNPKKVLTEFLDKRRGEE